MDYFNSIWQGLLTGMVLSLMLGTVFFSLIRNSILSGYKTGIYIALGVIISDIMFISLAMLSSGFAVFLKEYRGILSVAGGSALIIMGIFMFIRAKPEDTEGKSFRVSVKNPWYYIGNGILLNVVNPVNFFSWLAISTALVLEYDYTIARQSVYFSSSLLSIFFMETGIAYFASRLRQWMTNKVIERINQISACVFIAVGIRLIFGI